MGGETYLTRLWCIIELFTFIHIGGTVEDIFILPIIPQSKLRNLVERFDVSKCKCSNPEDFAKIRAIIQAVFEDDWRFNREIRKLLRYTLDRSRASSLDRGLTSFASSRRRTLSSHS